MTLTQVGHFGKGEIEYLLEHDGVVLLELDDVSWDFDAAIAPGGAGLGDLQDRFHKRTGPPKGTWSISRKLLQRANDKGSLFEDLLCGSAYIVCEWADAAAGTLTTKETITSMLQIREVTNGTVWEEGVDFTVNYTTHVITFVSTVPAGGVEVRYLTTTASLMDGNKIQDAGIESAITNIWSGIATGVASQSSAAKYIGTYSLLCTVSAQNDGLQYDPNIAVIPGRSYTFRFWAQGTKDETLVVNWTDAGGSVAMTGSPFTFAASATWQECSATFTPDEATILNIQIINSAAGKHNFYVDELYLGLTDPTENPLDGQRLPFEFTIIARHVQDQTNLFKLKKCAIYKLGVKSGEAYTESFGGNFLEYEGQP